MEQCPSDFFHDALSSDSFLRSCLLSLASFSNDHILFTKSNLKSKIDKLFDHVSSQFNWDPRVQITELDHESEEDEDAPVVVEL